MLEFFPELKTERLLLRKITVLDYEAILFLRSDAIVNKFIERSEDRKTKNKADAIKFIKETNEAFKKNKSVAWGITLHDNPKIIGSICLWNFSENSKIAEVGYDLSPHFHNNGIMSEALQTVVEFGFKQLKLDKIEAFTHIKNEPSKRLLKKCGFKLNVERKDSENEFNVIFEFQNTYT